MQATWMNEMVEVSSASGNFLKFAQDEDEKIIKIVKDPVKGISKFPYPDGSPKVEFKIEVLEGDGKDIKIWAVTNRSIMQQIIAMCKKEGMQSIAGCVIRATATGNGKDRRYFLKLLQKPGTVLATAQVSPSQQPPQGQDQGAAWLEQQKAGAQ